MDYRIFTGLGEPKCQLFFDLQAMIAINGGRLHLAEILECEAVKSYLPKQEYKRLYKMPPWNEKHEQLIIDNWGKVKSSKIYLLFRYTKTKAAVNQKVYNMRKKGLI